MDPCLPLFPPVGWPIESVGMRQPSPSIAIPRAGGKFFVGILKSWKPKKGSSNSGVFQMPGKAGSRKNRVAGKRRAQWYMRNNGRWMAGFLSTIFPFSFSFALFKNLTSKIDLCRSFIFMCACLARYFSALHGNDLSNFTGRNETTFTFPTFFFIDRLVWAS